MSSHKDIQEELHNIILEDEIEGSITDLQSSLCSSKIVYAISYRVLKKMVKDRLNSE